MTGAPTRLRCEFAEDPMGLDEPRPRLSWWPGDDRPAELQSAYRIQVATSAHLLETSTPDLWDTGTVASAETAGIAYAGARLLPFVQACWRVQTFDSDGLASSWSQPGRFELGPLGPDDWRGRWVLGSPSGSRSRGGTLTLLAGEVRLSEPAVYARLYVSARGVYQPLVNGVSVGRGRLAPGWTDYRTRCVYHTYDILPLLTEGRNALGVLLGDGWFAGALGRDRFRQHYGQTPGILAYARIQLRSGRLVHFATDHRWRARPAWIQGNDLGGGEDHDLRLCVRDWCLPGGVDGLPVAIESTGDRLISAALQPPPSLLASYRPLARPVRRETEHGESRWRFDFGEVIHGHVRIRTRAPSGSRILVRYGLTLDSRGDLVPVPDAEDGFTCDGSETWLAPAFALRGFQYVEVQGPRLPTTLLEIEAQAVGTPIAASGEFECDHLLLNQLHQNLLRTVRCCALDVPMAGLVGTDRLGLTRDAPGYLRAAAWQQDLALLFGKWLADLVDAQDAQGQLPAAVPAPPDLPLPEASGRAETLLQLAWLLYRHYGDRRSLERAYPAVRRYVFGTRANLSQLTIDGGRLDRLDDGTPGSLVRCAWFAWGVQLAARIAAVLGRGADLSLFEQLTKDIAGAFQRHFVTPEGRLLSQSQTAYTLALGFNLLQPQQRRPALAALLEDLTAGGYQVRVGPSEVPVLLQLLSREGQLDMAYTLVLQTSGQSWLSAVMQGATTAWDRQGGRCQLAAIGVGDWLYSHLLGLDLDTDLGTGGNAFRRVRMAPQPPVGPAFPEGAPIRFVRGALDTVHGRYELSWQLDGDRLTVNARVPANGQAALLLPDGSERTLVAGECRVTLDLNAALPADQIPTLRDISNAS